MASFFSGLTSALTGGATGYLQGQAANLHALVAEEARRRAEALAERRQANADAELAIKARVAGYTPPSTTLSIDNSNTAPEQTPPPMSFGDALEAGLGTGDTGAGGTASGGTAAPSLTTDVPTDELPDTQGGQQGQQGQQGMQGQQGTARRRASSLTTPIGPRSLGTIPKVNVTSTPESYDFAQSAAGHQLQARNDALEAKLLSQEGIASDRLVAQAVKTDRDNATRIQVAKIRAAALGGAGGRGRTMPPAARENFNRHTAKAILYLQGSPEKAVEWLETSQSPEARQAREDGVTRGHINTEAGLQEASDATIAARSHLPSNPARQVGRVTGIRDAVRAAAQARADSSANAAAPANAAPANGGRVTTPVGASPGPGPSRASTAATDVTKPQGKPQGKAQSQQRRDYDAAAAALRAQGKDVVSTIGPPPP